MGVWFFQRNSSFSSHCKLIFLTGKGKAFLCNTYIRASAVPLSDDSEYSTSNCERNSETKSNVFGDLGHHLNSVQLFFIAARVVKSLNWGITRKMRFTRAVEKHGFDQTLVAFKMLVHIYACARMPMETYALLRDMVNYYQNAGLSLFGAFYSFLDSHTDAQVSTFVANVLIKVFASNRLLKDAIDVFVQARSMGFQLSIRSSNFLLKCLKEANERERLVALFEEMNKYGPYPTVYSYTIVLNFLCTGYDNQGTEDIAKATDILEEMESAGISPSTVTYSTYLVGLCRVGLVEDAWEFVLNWRRKGRIEEALTLIDKMKSLSIYPNMFAYSAVINRLCKEHKSEKALELIPVMLKSNTYPNVVIYSALIDGFAKQANPTKAGMLYGKMLKLSIRPDLITYTILINMLSSTGRVEEAWQLFEEMKSEGLNLDIIAYTSMIDGFCQSRDMEKAMELVKEMEHKDISPSVVTYTCLIDGFCEVGCLNVAKTLLKKYVSKQCLSRSGPLQIPKAWIRLWNDS